MNDRKPTLSITQSYYSLAPALAWCVVYELRMSLNNYSLLGVASIKQTRHFDELAILILSHVSVQKWHNRSPTWIPPLMLILVASACEH